MNTQFYVRIKYNELCKKLESLYQKRDDTIRKVEITLAWVEYKTSWLTGPNSDAEHNRSLSEWHKAKAEREIVEAQIATALQEKRELESRHEWLPDDIPDEFRKKYKKKLQPETQ